MSLADLNIETQEISANGKALFTVRGLCFNDITTIIRAYGDDLDKVLNTFSGADVPDDEVIFDAVLRDLPHVVALGIALAADEPDQVDKVSKLGLPIQLDAVKTIWRLTIDSSGGLKKLIDSLMEFKNQIETDVKEYQNTGT